MCSWPLAPGQNKHGKTETFRCCKMLRFMTSCHARLMREESVAVLFSIFTIVLQ
jgi:hypothetical protein